MTSWLARFRSTGLSSETFRPASFSAENRKRAGPGPKAANATPDLFGAGLPVDPPVIFLQHRSQSREPMVLRVWRNFTPLEALQGLHRQLGSDRAQVVRKCFRGVI